MPGAKAEVIEVAGREVTVTNPGKVFFPQGERTKLDMVRYYLSVADGAVLGVKDRPMALKRFVNGAEGEAFFQKRAPDKRPDFIGTVELKFPSGRTASEIVVEDAAALAWVINLGCIDLNPHPIRANDLDHPDELRVDLDPVPGVEWAQITEVALVAKAVLEDHGLVAWPKRRDHGDSTSTAGSSSGGRSPTSAGPRSRWPGRSSAAPRTSPPANGGRKSGTGSSSTTTRTPRTAPSRPRTRSGRCRTRGFRPR